MTLFKYLYLRLQLANDPAFAYRAVHIWNKKNLKDCSSLKIFKVALKKHLLAKDNI
jgi:hypothetical protein